MPMNKAPKHILVMADHQQNIQNTYSALQMTSNTAQQQLEINVPPPSQNSGTLSRFIDGAISGFVSGAILQPLQVIKTSMQVSPIEKPNADHHHQSKTFKKLMQHTNHKHYDLLSFKEATMLIYEREGMRGYFRGFFPSLLKSSFNSATYFSSLHYLRLALGRGTTLSDNWVNFWASAAARGIESTLANPLIVVKTRLEVLGFTEYTGLRDAFQKIYRNEGAAGFFTGLKISLIRDVPFSGLFYPIYEMSKGFYQGLLLGGFNNDDVKLSNTTTSILIQICTILYNLFQISMHSLAPKFICVYLSIERNRLYYLAGISMLSSMTANIVSCVVTHPLDIIRTRTFFQYYNKDQTQHYSGLFEAIRKIHEHDGMIGYFRGLTPRIMRKGLANIVSWALYEYLVDKRQTSGIRID